MKEVDEEIQAWKKAMGFPHGDKPLLPPPSLNETTEYFLTRAEGQLVRLNELISKKSVEHAQMQQTLNSAQHFLHSLRVSLDNAT